MHPEVRARPIEKNGRAEQKCRQVPCPQRLQGMLKCRLVLLGFTAGHIGDGRSPSSEVPLSAPSLPEPQAKASSVSYTKSSRQIQMTHPNTHKTNTLCNTSNILRVHRIDGGNAATSNCQREHRCCSLCNTSFSGPTMRFQL